MDKKHLVTQSNNLIEAKHTNPLTAREQKIVLTMVSMIEPQDSDFKDYRISIKDFSEMLGLDGSAKYSDIKAIAKQLVTKTIEIPQPNGDWLVANWIASAQYLSGEGAILLSFSPKLKPYMLQLKNQFTSYRLSNVLSLRSTYSIRLYELMIKWKNVGKCENSVDELKQKLGTPKGSYERYTHFKKRLLEKSIKEVNDKTDLNISFTEIKSGRGVERIQFTILHTPEKEITLEKPKKEKEEPIEQHAMRTRLNALADRYQFDTLFFSKLHQGARIIWKDDVEQELTWLVHYVNAEKSIKNPLGFIRHKITTAWEVYQAGGHITFVDLQSTIKRTTGRQEILPDWFTTDELPSESDEPSEPHPDLIKEKDKVMADLAKKKAEIANKTKK